MINFPVKFIRGNFDYFLGRLNSVFYEEASALQFFVLTILLFVRIFCVNLTIFNRFKNILSTRWEGCIKGVLPPGSLKQRDYVYNECKLFNEHKHFGWCRYHLLTFVVWSPNAVFPYLNSNNSQPLSNGFLSNETNFQMLFIEDS